MPVAAAANNDKKPTFCMVWRLNGALPTRMYDNVFEATNEAVRLATANPAHTFYVLETVRAVYRDPTPPVVEIMRQPGLEPGEEND